MQLIYRYFELSPKYELQKYTHIMIFFQEIAGHSNQYEKLFFLIMQSFFLKRKFQILNSR